MAKKLADKANAQKRSRKKLSTKTLQRFDSAYLQAD